MKWIWITACCMSTAWAQQGMGNSFSIGLRAGETSGLTLKKSIASRSAIEGIIGIRHYGGSLTALYEQYAPAFNTPGLNIYYGVGGHLGYYQHHHYFYGYHERYDWHEHDHFGNTLMLGVDGIVGIEYKLPSAPIAFSFDLKPFLEFGNRGGIFSYLDPGLGVKVTL